MNFPADTYSAIADVSAAFTPPPATGFNDIGLLEAQRALAEIRRRVDAASALIAAEIAHRSRRELGYDGLAQRLGARTPELLVQQVTGASARDARTMVRVGALMSTDDPDRLATDATPWLKAVAVAVAAGTLSLEAADVIRAGLGTPDDEVTADALAAAAEALVREAASLTVERLAARVRDLRTELDLSRVLERENELRERRYLHLIPQADGMTRLSGLLDPESAALVGSAYDAATSPRRGGPRFVDPESVDRAERLLADERTTEQIALDSFVELIRIGGLADDGAILGKRAPAVQLLVTDHDLRAREGVGRIEGQSEAVSIETVERNICAAGAIPILFDDKGQVVNLGREQRLFSRLQHIGLAARDGGCIANCDRPPSWTEAHHIDEWHRDGGATDIADGVLLCRHHHLLVHNNGWRVIREGAEYFLVPPASIDPEQRPIPAPSRSHARQRLLAQA
jgi:hypothetical protein